MTQYNKYLALLLLILSRTIFAVSVTDKSSYWQCITEDGANNTWSAKSNFQKAALNMAFASCKKESTVPSTCKTSESSCEGFNLGPGVSISNKPMWRCTALDEAAEAWRSTLYSGRDDAALGAKAFCKDRSDVPDTCYVNFVTCINLNDRDN